MATVTFETLEGSSASDMPAATADNPGAGLFSLQNTLSASGGGDTLDGARATTR